MAMNDPMPWERVRPELVKDADGFYPGQRETGMPDFLSRAKDPQAKDQPVSLPWLAKS